MNKKGQVGFVVIIIILIIGLVVMGFLFMLRENNLIKNNQEKMNKINLEIDILRQYFAQYYNPSEKDQINKVINLQLPCYTGMKAYSPEGLLEYSTSCFNNQSYVKIPVLYYDNPTRLIFYNGTSLIPVEMKALKDVK